MMAAIFVVLSVIHPQIFEITTPTNLEWHVKPWPYRKHIVQSSEPSKAALFNPVVKRHKLRRDRSF